MGRGRGVLGMDAKGKGVEEAGQDDAGTTGNRKACMTDASIMNQGMPRGQLDVTIEVGKVGATALKVIQGIEEDIKGEETPISVDGQGILFAWISGVTDNEEVSKGKALGRDVGTVEDTRKEGGGEEVGGEPGS